MFLSVVNGVRNFDLESLTVKGYASIDRQTRTLFIAALILNFAAFFVFIAHHPLHNHSLRMPWIPWNEQIYLGRWFNHIMLRVVHASDMPVFLPLLSSIISVCTGILLLKMWELKLSALSNFLVIGFLTTFPFFLAFYYYTWVTPLFMSGPFFAVASLFICRRLKIAHVALGAFLFMLMMASYQPALSVYATVAASCLIVDLVRTPKVPLLQVVSSATARILSAIIGGGLYLLSLPFLKIKKSHATTPIEMSDLPDRIKAVVDASFTHLTITQPEFHDPMKFMLLILLGLAILGSFFLARKSIFRLGIVALLWIGAIIATKTMFFISADASFYQYRYNTSLAFFHAFTVALSLHAITFKPARSFVFLLAAFVLLRFVQADLTRQEVLLRGQQHDLAFANRILLRIETLPDIDFSKTYDFVRVGKYGEYRNKLLKSRGRHYRIYGDSHMDNGEISERWVDEEVLNLLGNKIKFKHNGFDADFVKKINDARARFKGKRQPWPHKDSVFIEGDTIYVYIE